MKLKLKKSIVTKLPISSGSAHYLLKDVLGSYTRLGPISITGSRKYELAACIRVKNESRFLPELIAHHFCIGFQHFYLYDNESTDNICSELAPLIERGLVTIISWPVRPASPACYQHFLENFGSEADWIAFIDADEFIIVDENVSLLDVLKSVDSAPALALNWLFFGSTGYLEVPPGLVIENFVGCDLALDLHVKVIARPSSIVGYYNSHNFFYRDHQFAINIEGRKALGTRSRLQTVPKAYIRHYVYRAKSDYLRKATLGFVDSTGAAEQARRQSLADFELDQHNERKYGVNRDHLDIVKITLKEWGFKSPIVLE